MSQKKKPKVSSNVIIVLFISLLTLGIATYIFIYFFMPNNKKVPFYKYYSDLNQEEVGVIMEDERKELVKPAIVKNNEAYLPVEFVKKYFDEYILWENAIRKVTITTGARVIRVGIDENTWSVNRKEEEFKTPFIAQNETAYLPISFLNSFYNVDIKYNDEYNLLTVEQKEKDKQFAEITQKTNLRYEPDIKSPVLEKMEPEKVVVFEEDDRFTKVRTQKGLIGYIETKKLTNFTDEKGTEKKSEELPPLTNPIDGKINLLWDMITIKEANRTEAKMNIPAGVDVLSPTWFKFDEEKLDGTIIEVGDIGYVENAHAKGVQVWALIADEKNTIASVVLKDSEVRGYVIDQLLDYCALYQLDGINLDFERVSEDIAPDYIQFLRELYPLMRENNLVLSVDMYVPTYTKHYNRAAAIDFMDYLCVMTYDEYTNATGEAGPVASYGFVEKGLLDTMEEVPPEKIIMGIPLYSRIWKNSKVLDSRGPKMARKFFEDKNAQFNWDESLKLNYSEFSEEEGGQAVIYRTWLEDDRSLEEKMILFKKYNLAGVSSWVRGLETENTFSIIEKYLNN